MHKQNVSLFLPKTKLHFVYDQLNDGLYTLFYKKSPSWSGIEHTLHVTFLTERKDDGHTVGAL